jgi:hypothetical protein
MENYTKEKFENILENIYSENSEQRLSNAEELCWFVENYYDNLEFELLKKSIYRLIEIIDIEEDPSVGYKLGETIFEFLWLEKLSKIEEELIIQKLVKLKTMWIFPSYLDQEEYLHLTGVKDYIVKYRAIS